VQKYAVEVTPHITQLLDASSPVAIGISGGKDSSALALVLTSYLKEIGHTGPRVLVHSDLGRVEWRQSLPLCQRLAERLDMELVVVQRRAGDLMDRWLVRWANNLERYSNLECVKLILPWSTASMRFCTSELKTAVICRELIDRFPEQTILSAAGLRREESPSRAKAPVCMVQPKLINKTHQTDGYNWLPILGWSKEDVFTYHRLCDFPLHEAYTSYQSSRVSCAFCILGSHGDLVASSTCVENQDIYREMVALEIASSFSFQSHHWLGDVAPHVLSDEMRAGIVQAKQRAIQREEIEARIPKHLLYTKGWPHSIPTKLEARLLCDVRRRMADVMQFSLHYTDPDAILDRYAELLAARPQQKDGVQSFIPRQQELWAIA
jgi:3'-phosphoadenosine 5'-phosphosulfate sulfotransferase (PAPS reductase)/FAD synthetase